MYAPRKDSGPILLESGCSRRVEAVVMPTPAIRTAVPVRNAVPADMTARCDGVGSLPTAFFANQSRPYIAPDCGPLRGWLPRIVARVSRRLPTPGLRTGGRWQGPHC